MDKQSHRSLAFSTNLNNKLDCNVFTTIRKNDCFNRDTLREGLIINVFGPKEIYFQAKIKNVYSTQICNISPILIYLDTGYSYTESITIFSKLLSVPVENVLNTKVLFLVLQKIK